MSKAMDAQHVSTSSAKIKPGWHKTLAAACVLLLGVFPPPVFAGAFSANSAVDFSEGAYENTVFNMDASALQLAAGRQNGAYTSRVFDAGATSVWGRLSWTSTGKYSLELPNNRAGESGDGAVEMTGNVLLMHLNGESASIVDYSSGGHNGVAEGGVTLGADGLFGRALSFDGASGYVQLPASNQILSGAPFTLLAWIKTSVAQGEEGSEGRILNFHRLDGSYSTAAAIYAGEPAGGALGDVDDVCFIYATTSAGDHDWLCHQTRDPVYHDGNYHLIAATHDGTTARLYYDNLLVASKNSSFGLFGSTPALAGSFDANSRFFRGDIDEVAVFARALSATELLNVYERGVLRLDFSVRSCDDAQCDGEQWVLFDGSPPQAPLVSDNRFFQYRVGFTTGNPSISPQLRDVTVSYAVYTTTTTSTTSSSTSTSTSTSTSSSTSSSSTTSTLPAGTATTVPETTTSLTGGSSTSTIPYGTTTTVSADAAASTTLPATTSVEVLPGPDTDGYGDEPGSHSGTETTLPAAATPVTSVAQTTVSGWAESAPPSGTPTTVAPTTPPEAGGGALQAGGSSQLNAQPEIFGRIIGVVGVQYSSKVKWLIRGILSLIVLSGAYLHYDHKINKPTKWYHNDKRIISKMRVFLARSSARLREAYGIRLRDLNPGLKILTIKNHIKSIYRHLSLTGAMKGEAFRAHAFQD